MKDWKVLCTNARSETVSTTRVYREAYRARRCLVPADGFSSRTGAKGAKRRWLFTRTDGAMFCFRPVGTLDRRGGAARDLHPADHGAGAGHRDACRERQPVILARDQWAQWLDLKRDPADLLKAGPARFSAGRSG